MVFKVDLLPATDPRVRQFLDELFAMPELVAPAAILFGGQRWDEVEVVALLSVNGRDAALATLAPTNEERQPPTTIISLWMDPEIKNNGAWLEMGVALFRSLVEEAVKRYGTAPQFAPVTTTEMAVATEAQRQGVQFVLRSIGSSLLANW